MRSTKQYVLWQLLDHQGNWLSGDQLASQMAVTRATIWKAINALKRDGYQIESRKNHGYQYVGSSGLSADVINFYLPNSLDQRLHVFEQVQSTQIDAKQYLNDHQVTAPTVFIANQQLAGYGRRGRSFYSPAETGLYLSIVLPNPHHETVNVGLITTGLAVVIGRVLHQFFPTLTFQYKWVNDIYVNHHKVCGIITEATMDLESQSIDHFIVGIGINLTTAQFPGVLAEKAQGIDVNAQIDRNRFAATLIQAILATDQADDWARLLPEYRAHSMLNDQNVTLQIGNRSVSGTVVQIADNGGLTIEDEGGNQRTFTSGEVTKVHF